jgi:hypothetical protein
MNTLRSGKMRRAGISMLIVLLPVAQSLSVSATAQKSRKSSRAKRKAAVSKPLLWREPVDIKKRNLFYGAGGKNRQPQGRLVFLEEDKDGANPKFLVRDEKGVRWKIKLGDEAQSEVAATRLIWAAGYFVDEDYYLSEVKVDKLPRLKRGRKYVKDGFVYGARFERDDKGDKKLGEWDWFDNPFEGTRELNGLRVLMALINNWDPRRINNAVRRRQGVEQAYYVSDVGASFGRTGHLLSWSRNNVKDYVESEFVRRVERDQVDFVYHTRPPFFTILYPPYYFERTRLGRVGHDIPRADARWMGGLLDQLSDKQIADAFRAADYRPAQVADYTRKVRERIRELKSL